MKKSENHFWKCPYQSVVFLSKRQFPVRYYQPSDGFWHSTPNGTGVLSELQQERYVDFGLPSSVSTGCIGQSGNREIYFAIKVHLE